MSDHKCIRCGAMTWPVTDEHEPDLCDDCTEILDNEQRLKAAEGRDA